VRVAVSDLSSRILAEREQRLDTDHLAHEGLDAAADLVQRLLEEAGVDPARVIGAGMCLPGPVHADGVVGSTAILPAGSGWPPPTRCAAASTCRSRRQRRETWPRSRSGLGAGGEPKDLVYMMISSGIGARMVLNGACTAGPRAGRRARARARRRRRPVVRCGNRGCLDDRRGHRRAGADLLRRSHGDDCDGRIDRAPGP
jgi:predicted NBD/HSP70 family sugar kinase